MRAGKDGPEGDGDIYNPENLQEFQRFVLENTGQQDPGVHFVMADGVSAVLLAGVTVTSYTSICWYLHGNSLCHFHFHLSDLLHHKL